MKSKSWVEGSDSLSDSAGHGTHTLRLLLRVAPEADISVAKISATGSIEASDVDRIAAVGHWWHFFCHL